MFANKLVADVDQFKLQINFKYINAFQTDVIRNQSSSMDPVTGRQTDRWKCRFNEWFTIPPPNSSRTEESACYSGQILTSSLV